jgi:phospholipase/carboxylesterase
VTSRRDFLAAASLGAASVLGGCALPGFADPKAGAFGPDIAFLDLALRDTFARYRVDPSRLTVAGFSDGATMSLALGLANGDLFPRAVVWSPGYLIDTGRNGKPSLFFSHGTADPVLNIDTGSRAIVPRLRKDGYAVEYREFYGVHEVPDAILHESMQWSAAP